MAVKTYRVAAGADGNFGALSESDQTAASRTDGWTVAKIAAGNSSEFDVGVKQASGTFTSQTTTPKPANFLTGSTANAFKSPTALYGDFAATAWTLTFAVRAGTASSQAGRIRCRVFASKNADGSSARELTGSTQVGTTSSALSTSADVTTVVTWTPSGVISMQNEYLFFVIAWEITTASGSNNGDVLIRTGTSTTGTRLVTSDLAAPTAKSGSDTNSTTTEVAGIGVRSSEGIAGGDQGGATSYQDMGDGSVAWTLPAQALGAPDNGVAQGGGSGSITVDTLRLIWDSTALANISAVSLDLWMFSDAAANTITVYISDGTNFVQLSGASVVSSGTTTTKYTYTASSGLGVLSSAKAYIDIHVTTNGLGDTVYLDAADLTITISVSNASESASVNTGSGTPKSSSDTNSTTTEANTLAAAISSTDADGTPVDTASLAAKPQTTDTNSTTTENSSVAVPVAATDTNSTTTETQLLTVGISTTDVNGTTTDSATLAARPSSSDTNSTTTENQSVSVPVASSDINSTTTEISAITKIALSDSDVNSTTTETASAGAQVSTLDVNGATTEGQGIRVASVDQNSTTTENTLLVVGITTTDTNGSTADNASTGTLRSGTDQNGTTTETTATTAQISATDTNSTTTEAASFTFALAGSDTNGSTTENSSLVVALTSSDTNSVTTEAFSRSAAVSASDASGSTTEVSTVSVPVAAQDASGALTEGNTLAARLSDSDINSATTESAATGTTKIGTDANSTTTEVASAVRNFTSSDTGGGFFEIAIISQITMFGSDQGTATETQSISRSNLPGKKHRLLSVRDATHLVVK